MKPMLVLPDPPKSCWNETIIDLDGALRDQIIERIDSLLAHGVRRLYARLVAYRENKTSGFELLSELAEARRVLSQLSEEIKAAHPGIIEV
jgi:hypothetical protein